MPTLDEHIGSRLHARRRALDLTQTDVGRALGVSFQQVRKYERGIDRISASRLFAAARFLDVPITWFFRGAPPPPYRHPRAGGDPLSPTSEQWADPPSRAPSTSGGNGSPPARR